MILFLSSLPFTVILEQIWPKFELFKDNPGYDNGLSTPRKGASAEFIFSVLDC